MQPNYLPLDKPIIFSNAKIKALGLAYRSALSLLETMEKEGQIKAYEKEIMIQLFNKAYRERRASHFLESKLKNIIKLNFNTIIENGYG